MKLGRPIVVAVIGVAIALLGQLLQPEIARAEEGHGSGAGDLVWQGVNLAIVLGLLVYYGRRPIIDFFAKRREGIESDLENAARLLRETELRNSKIQRRLVDLDSQVEEIMESARRRAEDEGERIIAEARRAAGRIQADANAAVEQEIARAKRKLRAEAADLALELASAILAEQVGAADHDRLIDEFITRVEPGPEAGRR